MFAEQFIVLFLDDNFLHRFYVLEGSNYLCNTVRNPLLCFDSFRSQRDVIAKYQKLDLHTGDSTLNFKTYIEKKK